MTEIPSTQPAPAGFIPTPVELLQSIADSSSDPSARGFAAAMLSAASAAATAPAGWRLVPIDPTEVMLAMGSDARDLQEDDCDSANLATNTRATWAEMLRAAPLPPAIPAPEGEPCGEVWIDTLGAVHYTPLQELNCATRFKVYTRPPFPAPAEGEPTDAQIDEIAADHQVTGGALARDFARAVLKAAKPQPKGTACVDPMCACRGGPCAECPKGQREADLTNAYAEGREDEAEECAKLLNLDAAFCGYARIKDGEYKLGGMKSNAVMADGELHPIYTFSIETIERLHAARSQA